MNNVLITGGAGFIGSQLSLKLLELGYNVTVLDNLSKQIHGDNPEKDSFLFNSIQGKVNFINGSVLDQSKVSNALKDVDYLVHLAAETGTGQSMYELNRYTNVNVVGTTSIFETIIKNKLSINKFILASSRAVYGEGKYDCKKCGVVYPKQRERRDLVEGKFECKCTLCDDEVAMLPTDEKSKTDPNSLYGLTKLMQEKIVELMEQVTQTPYTILRFQNVYGPGQSLSNPYTGILSIFSNQIIANEKINIFEDGLESRDFIFVDDIVDGIVLSLENDSADNEIINLGTGKSVTVHNLLEEMIKGYGKNTNYNISGDFRIGDIRHNVAEITKAKRLLEFEPRTSIDIGLQYYCDWVLSQSLNRNSYRRSLNELKRNGLLFSSK